MCRLGIIISCLTPSMPPKRIARIASRSPSPPIQTQVQRQPRSSASARLAPEREGEATAAVASQQQQVKPCTTCARQITPRAKWARNWDEIKYCSTQCRTWRSVVPLSLMFAPLPSNGWWTCKEKELDRKGDAGCSWARFVTKGCDGSVAEEAALPLRTSSPMMPTAARARASAKDKLDGGAFALDAWVEANTLLASIRGRSTTLDDITSHLDEQLKGQSSPTSNERVVDEVDNMSLPLARPPGNLWETRKREIVRRAARRLVIFPFSQSALFRYLEGEHGLYYSEQGQASNCYKLDSAIHLRNLARSFSLWQGSRRLESLEDVSFAKGPIAVNQVRE